ncbi:hypothetical protein V6V47_14335 [Micromonospora sp. CPCC 205539]|uniref:hypothetical protein n=1 Tax=Micromonospora sp. CPCC 205539 TaxID=3122408 RepID=UPI002FF43690
MAIEWHFRVRRPFALREALRLTNVRLVELLGRPDGLPAVEARAATTARRRGGPSGPASDRVLDARLDPLAEVLTDDLDVFFEIPGVAGGALVTVMLYLPGAEDPGDDPEEWGLFVWVDSHRDPTSQVVSIAAVIALAECGDGRVIDESGILSDTRFNSPAELLERLRVPAPLDALDDAVDAVLARTRLRGRA